VTKALPCLTRAKCHGLVEGEEMTLLDEKIAALFRKSSPISAGAEPAPSVDRPVAEEAASEVVESEPAGEEGSEARVDDKPPSTSQGAMAEQTSSPWVGLDLDTAIRLRWALRDIKAKRTKLMPVSPGDLETLIEMGLVEIRDDAPVLSNEGHQALDQ
jgi:hypothetical protein